MQLTKKRLTLFVGALSLLITAGVVAFLLVGTMRESALEQKLGQLFKDAVNDTLTPQIDFDGVDFQQPKTLVLRGVRLTAVDPDAPSGSSAQQVTVFEAETVRIELARIPKRGQPLVFRSLELVRPTVRLIFPRNGDGIVGFSNLVRAQPGDSAVPLSDALQVELIKLVDASLTVDTRQPGTTPTVIDQVTTDLHIDATEGGRYHLAVALDRRPTMDATIDAILDIDARTLAFSRCDIGLSLGRSQDAYLPQSVQDLLQPYDMTGQAKLSVTGLLTLDAWEDSALDAELAVTDADATVGDYRLPIQRLHVHAVSADRVAEVRRIEADVFGGAVRGDAVIQLSTGFPFDLRLGGNDLALEESLRVADGQAPRYSGLADFQLSANGPLTDVMHELRGEGTLKIRQGRIARIAVISDLLDFMVSGGDLSRPEDGAPAGSDRAEVEFRLRGNHAYLNRSEIIGSWFAIRGKGKLFFERSMDIHVNAGPMEKVQDVLGPLGDVFGAVTDSLLAYRVRGTAGDPSIQVVAFGGLRGAPGSNEEDLPPWTPPRVIEASLPDDVETQDEQVQTPQPPRGGRGDSRATTTTPGRIADPNAE